MKFNFQKVGRSAARLGHLTELGRHGDKVWCTPACFVYTKKGSVPHLTHEVFQLLTEESLPLIFPLPTVSDITESLKMYSNGLGEFAGLNEHVIYSSVQDPAFTNKSGYNDKLGVSLWSKAGRKQVNVELFMEMQNAIIPDIYQALCDSDTTQSTSKKRIIKAVERSLEYLDKCLEVHQRSDKLSKTAVFGTIEGGFDIELRKRSAKLTAARPIDGYVIDGFNNYGPQAEFLNFEELHHILHETLKCLPEAKPRVMHSVWHPCNVIAAVELGIDMFDASYPFVLCERGSALVFELRKKELFQIFENLNTFKSAYELNLKEERFKDDFAPLVDYCLCYTCRRFTRAYINHLLNSSEMLASVLLMIHNLHHYIKFFEVMREALKEDWVHILKASILIKKIPASR